MFFLICIEQGACKLGDGDCNTDQDCELPFICGSNNCWTEFKKGLKLLILIIPGIKFNQFGQL